MQNGDYSSRATLLPDGLQLVYFPYRYDRAVTHTSKYIIELDAALVAYTIPTADKTCPGICNILVDDTSQSHAFLQVSGTANNNFTHTDAEDLKQNSETEVLYHTIDVNIYLMRSKQHRKTHLGNLWTNWCLGDLATIFKV